MSTEHAPDVAILMPKITDERRFSVRYAGLEEELRVLGAMSCFVESHTSYDADNGQFDGSFTTECKRDETPLRPAIVRDLTMSLKPEPLYQDRGIHVIHSPATNLFLADKMQVLEALPGLHPSSLTVSDQEGVEMAFDILEGKQILFKPATGSASIGIQLAQDPRDVKLEEDKRYLAQEMIDTSGGMPELGIEGMHNLRIISIDSTAIGGMARFGGEDPDILRDDIYGRFVHPEDFPVRSQQIVDQVHRVLRDKPGNGKNVIAIDVMRGINPRGEQVEVLCEVNRRPLRISAYDLADCTSQSQAGVAEMANRWDKAEAAMLASLLD